MVQFADVPKNFETLFQTAEKFVSQYFAAKQENPGEGTIDILGERYILVRASSMSVELFNIIHQLYQEHKGQKVFDVVKNLLFEIAHAIGKSDAAFFHTRNKLEDPIEKLSVGPIHFAFTGWANVKSLPKSDPQLNENYYLLYDHPFSFESDSWLKSEETPDFPVCFMNAGYSSGWCEQSFGIELVASEVLCRAKGDDRCRFIMAPPEHIRQHIANYSSSPNGQAKRITKYSIPGILDRKIIEKRLQKSEEQYQVLFENANDAIFIITEGKISDVNMVGLKTLLLDKETVIGKSFLDLSPRIHSSIEPSASIWSDTYSKAISGVPSIFEWQFSRPDGSTIDVEISLKLITKKPLVVQAICRDITRRKQLENQLIQSQKMEAIGSLASGIAHDFNNILAGMLGFSSLLKIKLPKSDENVRYLERIEGAVEKAGELTRQLLSFSRKSKPISVSLDVNHHINNIIQILDRTMDKKIEVSLKLAQDLLPIDGDPGQIEQMILNLCLNASQAMPEGGIISLRTWMLSPEEIKDDHIEHLQAQDVIGIEIVDQGIGMNQGVIERVFEPYFSLREDGSGTGLGMPIVYSIVKSHRGEIKINSTPQKGTRVLLFLPATHKPVRTEVITDSELIGGIESILIVDDDVVILELFKEILEPLGYNILTAGDGLEAIQVFEQNVEQIDLAILNAGMPKLGGQDVFRHLVAKHAGVKVILTSGLVFSEEDRELFSQEGISGYLHKPFKPGIACKTIREALDRK